MKNKIFIEKARKVHGDRYDYSLVEYVNKNTKVKIICKKHGEFLKIPNIHIRNGDCPKCVRSVPTTDEFIENARKVHGDRYDYSFVEYTHSKQKVKIICKVHGMFEQIPNNHLGGADCYECSGTPKSNTEKFILESNEVHHNRYDYSLVNYIDAHTSVQIICKEHGVFDSKPYTHKAGHGCKICAYESNGVMCRNTNDKFKDDANKIHSDLYDYSLVDYVTNKKKVKIICKVHGLFEQTPASHLRGQCCPKCTSHISKPEIEVFEFVKTLSDNVMQSNRKIIKPKELDIFCNTNKIAIEFNGLYWHSSKSFETHEEFKNKHLYKTIECEKLDIRLFHIFENEWNDKKEIWKSILTNAFNKSEFKTVTSSKKISKTVAKNFLKKNSLEEFNENSISIGYYSENDLICVLNNDILAYKLFTHSNIEIYLDKTKFLKINRRIPETLLQYKLIENTEPNPHFHNDKKFVKSENAFMSYANGYSCIWDCGYKIYKGKL